MWSNASGIGAIHIDDVWAQGCYARLTFTRPILWHGDSELLSKFTRLLYAFSQVISIVQCAMASRYIWVGDNIYCWSLISSRNLLRKPSISKTTPQIPWSVFYPSFISGNVSVGPKSLVAPRTTGRVPRLMALLSGAGSVSKGQSNLCNDQR